MDRPTQYKPPLLCLRHTTPVANRYDDPNIFSRRNATPPQGHPVDFIVDESRHPAVPSPAKTVEDHAAAAIGGLSSVRNSAGGRDSAVPRDSRSSSGSAGVRAGVWEVGQEPVGGGGGDSGGGAGEDTAVPSRQQIGSENMSPGASRGGGGVTGVRGSASLFDMVMSGASCSSQSSSTGGGGGGSGGRGDTGARKKLSIAAATGGRAEGGKPTTSTLSGILGGMRGGQAPPMDGIKGFDSIGVAGGAGIGGSNEDWMAINLEKLSTFRVPETRMGFPDGAREVCGGA